jgi:hypothetical protein
MQADSWLDALARSPWVRIAVVGVVLLLVARQWDPATGFTAMPRFGEKFKAGRLPVLRTLPLADSRGDGYDGQFYAQIAVQPRVTDPDLVRAVDKPAYRPRRILLPVLAHVLGAGRPWWVLQVYCLLNLAAWLWLAAVVGRLLPPTGWRPTAAWLGILLAVGALDSARLALTDLPAALLLVLAARAMELGRAKTAAAWCLLAGGVREVSLLAALLVRDPGGRGRTFCLRAGCTLPVLAWCAWLAWRLPGPVGHEGNIDWPGLTFARQEWRNLGAVLAGDFNPQILFGLLGGIGLAVQSLWVLARWCAFATDPWVAVGVPFALLFWLIGTDPWLDYRAVARDCLPMTIVFNLLWARRAGSHPLWLLANVAVIDGVMRLT